MDRHARTLDGLAQIFHYFGEVECPQLDAELYRTLCGEIRHDEELLALAAHAPSNQPAPNLLFGAVHYLLLGGATHELREWYPTLAKGEVRELATLFPAFRDFCLAHSEPITALIETRLTQTNVVQRCSGLLPAFASVFEAGGRAPLSQIEIGPSAGLNLGWDRFRYEYRESTNTREANRGERLWGDPESSVVVPCELRGAALLPSLPDTPPGLPVAWRRGVDLNPIDIEDPDAVQWLRALVWPDHVGRQERLSNAIAVARASRPTILTGDASKLLPELIEQAPPDTTLCVYGTHTLYQFPREALLGTLKAMTAASLARPIYFVSAEGTGDRCSELRITAYSGGERDTVLAARCCPHGRWLEWLEA
jgi:hypothetical protein